MASQGSTKMGTPLAKAVWARAMMAYLNTPGIGKGAAAEKAIDDQLAAVSAAQLKAEMFDYLCWLEDFCAFRTAALDGKAGDYLCLASDGTTCWGKTYAEAVRVAMEQDKETHDATERLKS